MHTDAVWICLLQLLPLADDPPFLGTLARKSCDQLQLPDRHARFQASYSRLLAQKRRRFVERGNVGPLSTPAGNFSRYRMWEEQEHRHQRGVAPHTR